MYKETECSRGDSPLIWVVVALVASFFVVYSVMQPLSIDQGMFMWAGHVIHGGGLMYRDVWDHKGPVPFYAGALVETLFGRNDWGMRLWDVLWQFVSCGAIYLAVRRLGGRTISAAAAVLVFLAWYIALPLNDSNEPDGWGGALIAISAALLIGRPRMRSTPWIVGFLIGICCILKITFAPFLLLPLIASPNELGARIRFMLEVGAGVAIPFALSFAYFGAHGLAYEYYFASLGYNVTYASIQAYSLPMRLWLSLQILVLSTRSFIPSLIAFYGLWTLRRTSGRSSLLILSWILTGVFIVIIQGKMDWLYHWVPTYPALAVAVGVGIESLISWWHRARTAESSAKWATPAFSAIIAFAILTVGASVGRAVLPWVSHVVHGSPANDAYEQKFYGEWGRGPGSIGDVSRYVESRTKPGDYVFFGSSWVVGNFLMDRPSPTRFMEGRPYMDAPSTAEDKKFLAEFVGSFEIHPPAYIVVAGPKMCATDGYEMRYCASRLPPLQRMLDLCYTREKEIGLLDVYRRSCPVWPVAQVRATE